MITYSDDEDEKKNPLNPPTINKNQNNDNQYFNINESGMSSRCYMPQMENNKPNYMPQMLNNPYYNSACCMPEPQKPNNSACCMPEPQKPNNSACCMPYYAYNAFYMPYYNYYYYMMYQPPRPSNYNNDQKKNDHIKKLKNLIKNDKNLETIGENYYEWEINDWNNYKNSKDDFLFTAGNYEWRISLFTNGYGDEGKGNVSVYIYNKDVQEDDSLNICAKYVISICNYDDYTCSKEKLSSLRIFKNYNNNKSWGFPQFVNINDLFTKNHSKKSLVENNKSKISVYICVYKYKKEQYLEGINNIKQKSDNKDEELIGENHYEWKIENWEKLSNIENSPVFTFGDFKW
eukprot:jgi/Orpsp1_1/1188247/evm.model.d7180000063420.1